MALVATDRRRPTSLAQGGVVSTISNWVAVDERQYPWNTIGTVLEQTGKGRKTAGLLTVEEALDATGMNIEVHKVPLKDQETGLVIPRLYATYHQEDEGRYYHGAVSDKYQVVQPRESLAFFNHALAQVEGSHISACWNMREKAMMGVTIELPQEIAIDPNGANDRARLHLLGVNSFDGSFGLAGILSATRWFCTNQIVPLLRGEGVKRSFSLRHTRNVMARAGDASTMLGVVMDYAAWLDKFGNGLHAKRMSDGQFQTFLAKLGPFLLDGGESDVVKQRVEDRRAQATQSWGAPHNANITGTRWGALNVVAEFAEWGRPVKGSHRTGTDPVRQRAIGTMVHPNVTGLVTQAAALLSAN